MDIEYQEIRVLPFTVVGVGCQTSNQGEMQVDTAKIPRLWNAFEGQVANLTSSDNPSTYAVYSEFQSGADGNYNIVAGINIDDNDMGRPAEAAVVEIAVGNYLKFVFLGSVPQVVQQGWVDIWRFFQENNRYKRAFKTDFEHYTPFGVEIYIGLEV